VDAGAAADVVVVPALAVGPDGTRLGRGGGSYDRALARVTAARTVIALLYDGEVLPDVPVEEHDRAVDAAVLPSGVRWFRPAGQEPPR
jgi:5-formyltetrahydrofolate cyclo-ligase